MEIKSKDLSSKKDGNILNEEKDENKNENETKSSQSLFKEDPKAKDLFDLVLISFFFSFLFSLRILPSSFDERSLLLISI